MLDIGEDLIHWRLYAAGPCVPQELSGKGSSAMCGDILTLPMMDCGT